MLVLKKPVYVTPYLRYQYRKCTMFKREKKKKMLKKKKVFVGNLKIEQVIVKYSTVLDCSVQLVVLNQSELSKDKLRREKMISEGKVKFWEKFATCSNLVEVNPLIIKELEGFKKDINKFIDRTKENLKKNLSIVENLFKNSSKYYLIKESVQRLEDEKYVDSLFNYGKTAYETEFFIELQKFEICVYLLQQSRKIMNYFLNIDCPLFVRPEKLEEVKLAHIFALLLNESFVKEKSMTQLVVDQKIKRFRDWEYISKMFINMTKISLTINNNQNIKDENLKFFKGIDSLELPKNRKISDKGMSSFIGIKTLILESNNVITDEGMKYLGGIVHLNLKENNLITGSGLKHISNSIKIILLGGKLIKDDDLKFLNRVERLELFYDDITDKGLKNISEIKILKLDTEKITNEGIRKLKRLKKLKLVNNDKISDHGLQYLWDVESLKLRGAKITNKGLKHLGKIKKLSLWNNLITDEGLKNLRSCEKLDLRGERITSGGIYLLKNIKILMLHNNSLINDEGLKEFGGNLEKLVLKGNRITDEGLKYLNNIRVLKLRNNVLITDIGLSYLPNKTLRKLNLGGTEITDEGISYIYSLHKLKLSSNNLITNKGVRKLCYIRVLYLNTNEFVTEEIITRFLTSITKYRTKNCVGE